MSEEERQRDTVVECLVGWLVGSVDPRRVHDQRVGKAQSSKLGTKI